MTDQNHVYGFLDTETGGFSVTKNGVCEIALIITNQELEPVAEYHHLIQPYKRPDEDELVSYKDDAMAINGLTVDLLISDGLPVIEAMERLWIIILKHKVTNLVAHNGKAFDLPRIEHLLSRFTGRSISHMIAVDTLPMARQKLPFLPAHKMEHLCAHYGVVNTKAHSAKGDALALLEVYKFLIAE